MEFNKHSGLEGKHAMLSPSKNYWTNYSDDKIEYMVETWLASAKGTKLHELAAMAIKLKHKFPKNSQTVNAYVNDAIGFRMTAEQALVYSEYCFGTADAIGFRKNVLRIFDLKTGKARVSGKQLFVYAALFCLEYGFKPHEIEFDLRIYQNDEIFPYVPDPDEILHIMDRIITTDKRIRELREEAAL